MVASLAKFALAGAVVAALAAGSLAGQAQQQQQQQKQTQQPAAQQPAPAGHQPQQQAAPQKLNPKEEADYKQFNALKTTDTDGIISKGESFVKNYPDSQYLSAVYSKLAVAYETTGSEAKMFAAAEKAVELNADNVPALSLLAYSLPRRINPNAPGAESQMEKVEQYANHAIELVSTMPKPADLTVEQFTKAKNEDLASCHSGLGMISYERGNVTRSIAEFELATQLGQDPVDYFLLGMAYDQVGRFSDAASAFTQCSNAGPVQDRCKAGLEDAKKKAAAAPAK
jgi:Flp pilus assembly protein TadD